MSCSKGIAVGSEKIQASCQLSERNLLIMNSCVIRDCESIRIRLRSGISVLTFASVDELRHHTSQVVPILVIERNALCLTM